VYVTQQALQQADCFVRHTTVPLDVGSTRSHCSIEPMVYNPVVLHAL
jgi:hypothetical protein